MKIDVVIADDHPMVLEGLEAIMRREEEIEIIGRARNGEELVQITRRVRPDVVLTDIKMPKMNGIQATRIIKEAFPHVGVVALSSFEEESQITDMFNAGAKGYLSKTASKEEIICAVKAVYRDEPFYCRHTNTKLARMIAKNSQHACEHKAKERLSEREQAVVQLMCEGLSSKQIAAELNLKTRTIERYRDNIMFKTGVSNATGVVIYAVRHGLYKFVVEEK